jgi:shikimate dehydrogenase
MRKNTVSAKTGLYAILGEPISHSMSPVIMNSQFDRLGLDNIFLAFRAGRESFATVMEAAKHIGVKGYVFTMPVKELAVAYMDELSREAELIGAVNCAVNSEGRLTGYNTDSLGFWKAVREKKPGEPAITKVFVMGMGGMARAAVAQAAIMGVKEITVANRLSEHAFVESFKQFLRRLNAAYPETRVCVLDWEPGTWANGLAGCNVVANATPNGMGNKGDLDIIFPFGAVPPECVFFDAVYEPRFTKFLLKAENLGFDTVEGIDLLANQGAISFFNWTSIEVEPEQMKDDILNFMEHKGKTE